MNSSAVKVKSPVAILRNRRFKKVLDARELPIRGLWIRNGRYYARISIEDLTNGKSQSRRVPLEGVTSAAQALVELNKLKQLKRDNALPILHRTPKFRDYVADYLAYYEAAKDAKRPKTIKTERINLDHWMKHMGDTRLNKITRTMMPRAKSNWRKMGDMKMDLLPWTFLRGIR